jgi:seryl-tRNA synthetase
MYDINWIKANAAAFDRGLKRRGIVPDTPGLSDLVTEILGLDAERRGAISSANNAQQTSNTVSRTIGTYIAQGNDVTSLRIEASRLKSQIPVLETQAKRLSDKLQSMLETIPNLPLDDGTVPDGEDERANREYFGRNTTAEQAAKSRAQKPIPGKEARPGVVFPSSPKEHFELGEAMGMMDFEIAAKLSGSRFVVLKSQLARMERALGQFMLDLHTTEHGYTEVEPPLLVRDEALYGTGQLPKFGADQYFALNAEAEKAASDAALQELDTGVISRDDYQRRRYEHLRDSRLWLIPTAEVPLTNLVNGAILSEDELPLRFAALTPCFRSEAGSAGRDTRGMLRQHQFNKVEMVSITAPESSIDEHERMLGCAEAVLQKLGLHYRVMTLSTGDMGFSSQKTYDLEVWLPGQDTYREISSVSVCGDFQARRMDARVKGKDGKIRPVHTLNGSGVAVGRALIAVMENYQQEDGSVAVPEVLRPYMGGLMQIGARS